MQIHVLNLSCLGRDALVYDWEMGAAMAVVTAFRVFATQKGFGVAYQSGTYTFSTQQYDCIVVPTRVVDGLATEAEAITWMRNYAHIDRDDTQQQYEEQGIAVLCEGVRDEVNV